MRLNQNHYYIIEHVARNCYGNDFDAPKERFIIKGLRAIKHDRAFVVDRFNPAFVVGAATYTLLDGHVLDCCPTTTSERRALDFLDANIFQSVKIN